MLVVGAPAGRALWVALMTPAATDALTSAVAGSVAWSAVLVVFSVALIVGTRLGPAALPPFLVYALADSDLPRRLVFRMPMTVATLTVASLSCISSSMVVGSLAAQRLTSVQSAVLAGASGALLGVVVTTTWLIGQAFPRVANAIALGLMTLAAAATISPALGTSSRAGLAALVAGPDEGAAVIVVLVVAAVVCASAAGPVLERLDVAALDQQARRRESAVAHSFSLDAAATASALQVPPSSGRGLRAVPRRKSLVAVFFWSDSVSALRSPSRLGVGLVTLLIGGAVMAGAFAAPEARLALGALAGALTYVGFGSISNGIRHAGHAVADLTLYGISDRRLMLLHCLFPLIVGTAPGVFAGVLASVSFSSDDALLVAAASASISIVVLAARVGDAVRGPSPVFLLTPAPSALGDPMPAIRILWALDGPVIAVLAGIAAAAGAGGSWVPLCSIAGLVFVISTVRWARRE
jgi:hypothetical protein